MPRMHADQWMLGQLIDSLEGGPPGNACRFDFCSTVPGTLGSYRGYYEDLALGWKKQNGYPEPTVKDVLATLRSSLGQTFHGYKGGEYVCSPGRWLWVANHSETGDTVVVGVRHEYQTWILTANTETAL